MIDGIAQIEISDKGNCRLKSLDWVDFRLEVVEFEDAEGLGQIMDQLPKFLSDVLVLVTFEYESNTSQSYEGEWDVEELFNIVNYQIIREDYKEFYRNMVTEELKLLRGSTKIEWLDENEIDNTKELEEEIVQEWEELFEEDFEPVIKVDKEIKSYYLESKIFGDRKRKSEGFE